MSSLPPNRLEDDPFEYMTPSLGDVRKLYAPHRPVDLDALAAEIAISPDEALAIKLLAMPQQDRARMRRLYRAGM